MENRNIYFDVYDSPIGKLHLVAVDHTLLALNFTKTESEKYKEKYFKHFRIISSNKLLDRTKKELDGYFNKKVKMFNIPLLLFGTEFQKNVWSELLKIPYGKTISYKDLALRVGSINGFRAVGNANGKNNIAIIIPCHRVINHNNELGGYGGGLEKKKFLLELEGFML